MTDIHSCSYYCDRPECIKAQRDELRERLAQPEQEPVAYTTGHCENHKQKGGCQLHNLQCGWPDCDLKPITTPAQRTWVGLTDEEAMQICVDCGCLSEDWLTLLDAIEAKLKEKNNE